jgi:hypothetical protein
MRQRVSDQLHKKIRREVLSGKSKYQVAQEFGLYPMVVYYHTKDIPSKERGRGSGIRGPTLEVLKQLLQNGSLSSTRENGSSLRTIQRLFPMVHRAEMNNRSIFFLEGKNKAALCAFLQSQGTRLIDFHKLVGISEVFDVCLSKREKSGLLGKM